MQFPFVFVLESGNSVVTVPCHRCQPHVHSVIIKIDTALILKI